MTTVCLTSSFNILHRRLGYPRGYYPCGDAPTKRPEPVPAHAPATDEPESTSADAPEAPAKREFRRVVFRAGGSKTRGRGPGARGRTGGRNPVEFRG